jgi:Fe-S cluster assembly ATP-binding protein
MKTKLQITNLHVQTKEGKKILHGISLTLHQGETHAILGPNGGGKTTFAEVLLGNPDYKITQGTIMINGKDITNVSTDIRAKAGLFLGFQYPVAIPGVPVGNFLRVAMNEQKTKNGKKLSPIAFRKLVTSIANELSLPENISKRFLNEEFSGGEKKKLEILQLALFRPQFAILDEPDSGLDVDSLTSISKVIKKINYPLGLLVITHYQRLLNYLKPQFIHVMIAGKIQLSGDYSLAKKIEKQGYEPFTQ